MRIPVFCSLIPTDLLVHWGFEPVFISADEYLRARPAEAQCVFHENLCSYSKALYDFFWARHEEFGLIIVPAACDAQKKLFNALSSALPREKIFIIDVPQINTEGSCEYLAAEFSRLAERLKKFPAPKNPPPAAGQKAWPRPAPKIGVIGSNVPINAITGRIEKFGFEPVLMNHCVCKSTGDEELGDALKKGGIREYARLFMEKSTCPRTDGEGYRKNLAEAVRNFKLSGVVVNALKFCDFWPFDYKYLKANLGPDFPLILIEHDFTAETGGQTMVRIDAFLENISKIAKGGARRKNAEGRYYVGIDSGSHATKLVCVDGDLSVVARKILPTGTSVKLCAKNLIDGLCRDLNIGKKEIARVVATGYGRNEIEGADEIVTEITCHAIGAYRTLGRPVLLIDIGGQDSKAIKIGKGGRVERFTMNDKCAAGTGRFLEVMSAKLGMSLSEFAEISQMAKTFVSISNMCSVFAESEVISLIASGKPKDEIAKGIHRSIAERTMGLVRRIEGVPPYFMAGGGAKNAALIDELKECLGEEVSVLKEPQFSGALGAAVVAAGGQG